MEPFLPLIVIALKSFVKKIGIKPLDNKGHFLNSFSWMILLLSFLQDIIKPPILPKILSDKYNSIKNIKIHYINGKNRFIKIVSSLSSNIFVNN